MYIYYRGKRITLKQLKRRKKWFKFLGMFKYGK